MGIHHASATRAHKTLYKTTYNSTALYALAISTADAGRRLVLASRLHVSQPIDVCSVFPAGAAGVTIDQSQAPSAEPAKLEVSCELIKPWLLGPYGVAVVWPLSPAVTV